MPERVTTKITCSDCGKTASVPFKPTAEKPVYCRECLSKHRLRQSKSQNQRSNPKQAWSRRREGWNGHTEKSITA